MARYRLSALLLSFVWLVGVCGCNGASVKKNGASGISVSSFEAMDIDGDFLEKLDRLQSTSL